MVFSCVLVGLSFDGIEILYRAIDPWTNRIIPAGIEEDMILVPLLIAMPAILVAFIFYALLTRFVGPRNEAEAETRCRKCGYILRGLREPICSECGERI